MGKNLRSELRTLRRIVAEYPAPPFTRADVETLEDAIYTIHGPKMGALLPGVEQALDSIRERIEVLLPPEE